MSVDTIVRVDPSTLLVGPNVRKTIKLTPEFVASIKEHGVLVPITVQETPEGYDVIDGQMRTLAAVDAGHREVPAYVSSPVENAGARIVSQLVVNGDRQGVTGADQVAAVKELALDFKMPIAQIVKKVGLPKAVVEQAITVGKSEQASTAFATADLTLEQAAKLAEHEFSKADLKELLGYGDFDHKLRQILDRNEAAALTKQLEGELKAAGVPLAAKPSKGDYYAEKKNKHLFVGGIVDKLTSKKISVEQHASCAGHAAWVGKVGYSGKVEIHYLCTDPAKFGHRDADRSAPKQLTEAEKVERAENAAAAKVWPSIVEVRQTWIREQLLTRKALPAGWESMVAWVTLELAGHGGSWDWGPFAAKLLGIAEPGYNSGALVKYFEKYPTKPGLVLLATTIARFELSVGDTKSWKGWRGRMVGEYLQLLASWGYGLSELEQELVDELKGAKSA